MRTNLILNCFFGGIFGYKSYHNEAIRAPIGFQDVLQTKTDMAKKRHGEKEGKGRTKGLEGKGRKGKTKGRTKGLRGKGKGFERKGPREGQRVSEGKTKRRMGRTKRRKGRTKRRKYP